MPVVCVVRATSLFVDHRDDLVGSDSQPQLVPLVNAGHHRRRPDRQVGRSRTCQWPLARSNTCSLTWLGTSQPVETREDP